ncbi:hypothetical protein ACJA3J_08245 [Halobacillus sp. SY10]|uniref:hypothetical protein n=1 Tax=Halobacillus sp. SY10 TaxID=3381356 RepID=UPI003878FB4A
MKRKKQQEEHGKNETNIDFDSLLKLASNLTQQEGLLSQWSQTAGTGEANDVDLSSIITDISKACSHTFAGLERAPSKTNALYIKKRHPYPTKETLIHMDQRFSFICPDL